MTPRRSPLPMRRCPTPPALVFGLFLLHGPTDAPLPPSSLPTALPGMSEPAKRSLLVTYYEALLDDEASGGGGDFFRESGGHQGISTDDMRATTVPARPDT